MYVSQYLTTQLRRMVIPDFSSWGYWGVWEYLHYSSSYTSHRSTSRRARRTPRHVLSTRRQEIQELRINHNQNIVPTRKVDPPKFWKTKKGRLSTMVVEQIKQQSNTRLCCRPMQIGIGSWKNKLVSVENNNER